MAVTEETRKKLVDALLAAAKAAYEHAAALKAEGARSSPHDASYLYADSSLAFCDAVRLRSIAASYGGPRS